MSTELPEVLLMTLWIVILFLIIIVGLTVGIRQLSVFTGKAVGRSTLRTHRIAEMIYSRGRIPRSWVATELEKGTPDGESRAREDAEWQIERLIKHFTKSSAFADRESRAELLTSLTTMRDRVRTEPVVDLVGPDPRVRRTVVFLDCGDTIADEGTEVKDENEVTQRADLIPGAAKMVRKLKQMGYTLALVADGPRGTFENILKPRRLWNLFDTYAISHEVGAIKPDASMFRKALDDLGIEPHEYASVVMVGNNLYRDIKGANDVGLTTVWLDWAPRRSKVPADASETPDYTIKMPLELIGVIEKLEASQEATALAGPEGESS